jgi:N-acylglucosamine 2-epimerase
MDMERELAFYRHHLDTVVLPFWLRRSIDEEYGGYWTCFDNTGQRLLSEDKFTWSQGRMVWVLAKLAAMSGVNDEERDRYLRLARSGTAFLMEHSLLENGNCTFLMDRRGAPKEQVPGQGYDTSIYADCFVILGLSRYAATSKDTAALDFARSLYASVLRRIETGAFRSEPYPTPVGYKAHGIPMIMLNVSQELADALGALGLERADVDRRADNYVREIMGHFVQDDVLHEMIDTQNQSVPDTLLGRYVNPGHTLEDMWFVMHQARGNAEIVDRATRVVLRTLEIGWDWQMGGLLVFADQDGGKPRGSTAGMTHETMVHKVLGDWSNKLWWPHSEALYATLLAYTLTGDERTMEWYQRIREYTLTTFPNPDEEIGEWIQIRDRSGAPQQKVVALPVKDPYHIARNLILIIELLQTTIAAA